MQRPMRERKKLNLLLCQCSRCNDPVRQTGVWRPPLRAQALLHVIPNKRPTPNNLPNLQAPTINNGTYKKKTEGKGGLTLKIPYASTAYTPKRAHSPLVTI